MRAGGIIPAIIGAAASLIGTAINAATKSDPEKPAQGAMPAAPQVTPVASSGDRALPGLQSRVLDNDETDDRAKLATSILGAG